MLGIKPYEAYLFVHTSAISSRYRRPRKRIQNIETEDYLRGHSSPKVQPGALLP